jgi:hypothetical protein
MNVAGMVGVFVLLVLVFFLRFRFALCFRLFFLMCAVLFLRVRDRH